MFQQSDCYPRAIPVHNTYLHIRVSAQPAIIAQNSWEYLQMQLFIKNGFANCINCRSRFRYEFEGRIVSSHEGVCMAVVCDLGDLNEPDDARQAQH